MVLAAVWCRQRDHRVTSCRFQHAVLAALHGADGWLCLYIFQRAVVPAVMCCRLCHFSCTFQHAVLMALYGTDGCLCHFQRAVLATLRGTDVESYRFQHAVLAALCNADVCLSLFLLLNVAYLLIYVLFADLCIHVGRQYDKTNVRR